MEWIIFALCIVCLIALYGFFSFRPKKLSVDRKSWYNSQLLEAASKEPSSALIACDTIFEHILKELWNSGSLWDALKRKWKTLRNIDDYWKYHKLRNRAVHDLNPPNVYKDDVLQYISCIRDEFLR